MIFFTLDRLSSSHERAKFVSYVSAIGALSYHILALIAFCYLKINQMFYYNIVSVTVFSITLCFLHKFKSYVLPYTICVLEVYTHQILGDYFLGTISGFHFFILLMGLLPFLVFEDRFKTAIPYIFVSMVLFLTFENLRTEPRVEISDFALNVFRDINITFSVTIIFLVILVYTYVVYKTEYRLKKRTEQLESEIELASVIQQNFFKQETVKYNGWEIDFYNKAMAGVSGDLFDIYRRERHLNGFGIFDVSGHGISSGLVTMLVKNIIHQEFYKDNEEFLWETVTRINNRVVEEKGGIENYLTGILVKVRESDIEYVNAGHPVPLLYKKATESVEVLQRPKGARGAIGIEGIACFFDSQYLTMSEGDELILYTDGITETQNASGLLYGHIRLIKAITDSKDMSVKEQIRYIFDDVNKYRGSSAIKDDQTIIILRKVDDND